jgi:hypothetical protein
MSEVCTFDLPNADASHGLLSPDLGHELNESDSLSLLLFVGLRSYSTVGRTTSSTCTATVRTVQYEASIDSRFIDCLRVLDRDIASDVRCSSSLFDRPTQTHSTDPFCTKKSRLITKQLHFHHANGNAIQ